MRLKHLWIILLIIPLAFATTEYTRHSKKVCTDQVCQTELYPFINFYYENGWHKIDQMIKNYENDSIIIAGRDYKYGNTDGFYSAYFRERSSDVNNRPIAIVKDEYTITYSPDDYITFEPHQYNKKGILGNRIESFGYYVNYSVRYDNQYKKINYPGPFANLTYMYVNEYVKELLVIGDKQYVKDRFFSQCNIEDFNITNLVFSTIIRAYEHNDTDNLTLGIFYGNQLTNFKQFGYSGNGEFNTTDNVYFYGSNGSIVAHIPKMYAYDSNGSIILLSKKVSMNVFGNLKIDVLVPATWLFNVTYPVYIDPFTQLDSSDVFWDGYVYRVNSLPPAEKRVDNPAELRVGIEARAGVPFTNEDYLSAIIFNSLNSSYPYNVRFLNITLWVYNKQIPCDLAQTKNCFIGLHHMAGTNDTYANTTAGNTQFKKDMENGTRYDYFNVTHWGAGGRVLNLSDLNEDGEVAARIDLAEARRDGKDWWGLGINVTPRSRPDIGFNWKFFKISGHTNPTAAERYYLNTTWIPDECIPPFTGNWNISATNCTLVDKHFDHPFGLIINESGRLNMINSSINVTFMLHAKQGAYQLFRLKLKESTIKTNSTS